MEGNAFYVRNRDQVRGPFTRQQLALHAAAGRVKAAYSISADREKWVLAEEVDWLFKPTDLAPGRLNPACAALPPTKAPPGQQAQARAHAAPVPPPRTPSLADPPGQRTAGGRVAVVGPAPAHESHGPAPAEARESGVSPGRPVFVSHSTEDAEGASHIVDALESSGIDCWMAPRNIPHGSNWEKSLTGALDGCRMLLLVFSRHAVTSNFVACEVEEAARRGIPILPVKLDEADAPFGMKSRLRQVQWVDANLPPISRHLAVIAGGVNRLLGLDHAVPDASRSGSVKYIGPYQLGTVLGEGGMGTVYKADQIKGVKRVVALKLIKPGFDTDEVVARFASEQQALARMNHPNIARFLDVGVDNGRSFFVMEYVPGVPITQFADNNKLSTRQRLELFLQVCDAISHAHSKSIIHRDIKPGNVLTFMSGDKPTAKVIDFGIAKALSDERLADRALNTTDGRVVGTYSTMSPEQAEGSPDLDTRSDVYSLGVLLYELITGIQPYDPDQFNKASDLEARRVIREVEPTRPSTRLTTMGEDATRIAGLRQTRVDSLRRELRNELEWIPLMAMRKERQRRYASPLLMAEDIQNYLQSRPLMAGPESKFYRFRKFARRNRVALSAVLAFIVTIGAGTTHHMITIQAAENEAKRQTQTATTVNQFLSEMLGDADPKKGNEVRIVDAIAAFSRKLSVSPPDDPLVAASIWDTIGDVQRSLGQYDNASASFDSAEQICTNKPGSDEPRIGRYLARVWDHRGHLLKDKLAARVDDLKAHMSGTAGKSKKDWWKGLDADAAADLKALYDHSRENYDNALKLFNQTPAYDERDLDIATTLSDRASLLQSYKTEDDAGNHQRLDEAAKNARDGLNIRIKKNAPVQDVLQSMGSLVDILIQTDPGNLADARKLMSDANARASSLQLDDPNRARLLLTRARLLKADGDLKGAEDATRDAVLIDNKALGPVHRYTLNALSQLNKYLAEEKKGPMTVEAAVGAAHK